MTTAVAGHAPDLATAALSYRRMGLCVLPASKEKKRPAIPTWKNFQTVLPTEGQVQGWFSDGAEGCWLICGAVSGNLEMMDFDFKATLFEKWNQLVLEQDADLFNSVVMERSQSGGLHVYYRCEVRPPGNLKLARRLIPTPSGEVVQHQGTGYKPRKIGDKWFIEICLIETRGEGGLVLCAPTPGYVLKRLAGQGHRGACFDCRTYHKW